jgi:hypothetical protein
MVMSLDPAARRRLRHRLELKDSPPAAASAALVGDAESGGKGEEIMLS